jgi:serine phosphatase RsbU (regulator of sigma subunit)
LLPRKLPICTPFSLAAVCQNAFQVGGDFYDAIPVGDGTVLLVIADVMGKGVPAALFAAVLRSTIRSMPQLFAQPAELLAAVNRILFPDLSRVNMFITAVLVHLNPKQGTIISASAGHCPLLLFLPGKSVESQPREAGFPLGIEAEVQYVAENQKLPAGTAVLIHTDGLTETRNESSQMLGEHNLKQILDDAVAQTADAEAAANHLVERLTAYRRNAPLADDQTFILIRHKT